MLHERVAERWRLHARVAKRWRLAVMTMPVSDALKVLGFPPNAEPTDDEVHRRQRQKAVEIHPDRGGDPAALVEVNNAADALKQYNERKDQGGGVDVDPGYGGGYGGGYTSGPRPKPEPQHITWEQAEAAAGGVPSGVDWKFKTQNAYGGYGDTSSVGFVVVGLMGEDKWLYVAVEHYTSRNPFTGEDVDEYWMKSQVYMGTLRDVAPKAIRAMFQFPHVSKQFNAKIELLPEGTLFNQKLSLMMHARAVSFKDGMELLGELREDDPWKGRKLQITMVLNSEGYGEDRKETIELLVNGRSFKLDAQSVEYVKKKTKVLDLIFGTYVYFHGDKKMLTKAKNGKKVLEFLAEKLVHEPQQLRDALLAAAGQM